ncbi:beta-glucoside-specific PTS transporter subunit IIABC [Corynebacterium glyciniphilum]|uniref:beta-glucoside-specific PTS transporter subunit IIABC n=1 Tax=Corynebacterium glyciniphilum TaxID=1404244 RepID=UPI003DA0C2C3
MNYSETARLILEQVGGASNIRNIEHCSTRLRLTIADSSQVDVAELKGIEGVLGVVQTAQTQIIIGNEVVEVYAALKQLAGATGSDVPQDQDAGNAPRRKVGAVLLDFLVAVFQPLIPVIAGAGVLKSIMILLETIGLVSEEGPLYISLVAISDAAFYFLPLMVAVTTANKLNANRLVAMAAVGVLLLPSFTEILDLPEGFVLFGLPVPAVPYAGQVFPAILSIILLSVVERWVTSWSPKPIRTFFVPMITLMATVPTTLVALGPLGYYAGQAFTGGILWLYGTIGWVATALLAAVLPLLVAAGMHKALLPYAINQFSTSGKEALYTAASIGHNFAEAGMMLAVALRTRNTEIRATAISAFISALCGITEPALYGITIQYRRALYSVMVGGAVGAAYAGIVVLQGFVLVSPGVPSFAMWVDPDNPFNIVQAGIAALISFGVAGIMGFILWRDPGEDAAAEENESDETAAAGQTTELGVVDLRILAPLPGSVIPLSEVPDPVFSGGAVGEGIAIRPIGGEVVAPASGTVAAVMKSGHAVAIRTDEGVEVLIHVGLDTVKLDGKPFDVHVAKGDKVTVGQTLLTADLKAIEELGYDTVTPVIVTNTRKYKVQAVADSDAATNVSTGDPLIIATVKESTTS